MFITTLPGGIYPAGSYSITTDTTLNGAIQLLPDAEFDIAAGVTLTLGGPFEAPRERVFTGAGKVKFADGAVEAVRPEWWGFAAGATAAVNDAARLAARDSITMRGTVRFPAGAFEVSDYVPINRDYIRFEGDSRFGTVFQSASTVNDVTGIDGTLRPGGAGAIDECQHVGIGVLRNPPVAATFASAVPTGPRGFVHRLATNALIEGKFSDNAIDYYEAQTSGARVDILTARSSTPVPGSTGVSYRLGVFSDCTLPAFPDASANGSSYKRVVDVVSKTFAGEAWGVYVYGTDLRDGFWERVETAGGDHAFDIVAQTNVPEGVKVQAFDIHLLFCVLDGWKKTGLRILNLPAGSRLEVTDGYSAPVAPVGGLASIEPSVQILASSGVTIGRGFEAKGGANFPLHTAVLVKNSARFVVECNITGAKTGILVDNSAQGIVSVSCEPQAEQPMQAGVSLVNGSSRVLVTGGVLAGAGVMTYGVLLDATSTYNTIGAYSINGPAAGGVVEPLWINGAAPVLPAGAGYVDVNHNRVLAGATTVGL